MALRFRMLLHDAGRLRPSLPVQFGIHHHTAEDRDTPSTFQGGLPILDPSRDRGMNGTVLHSKSSPTDREVCCPLQRKKTGMEAHHRLVQCKWSTPPRCIFWRRSP